MIVAIAHGATLDSDHVERLDPARFAAVPGARQAVTWR